MRAGEKDNGSMYFLFWSEDLNAVAFNIGNGNNVLFDIVKEEVSARFSGEVIGTNPKGTLVAVYPDTKDRLSNFKVIDLNKLP